MKVAIIAGKCDGCGVSTYLFELQKAFNKYAGTCDYYVYDCHVIFDVTKQEEMNLWMNYASEISIKNNWEFDKLELDNE